MKKRKNPCQSQIAYHCSIIMKLINVYVLNLFFFHCFVSIGDAIIISKDGDYIIEFILSIHDDDWIEGEKDFKPDNVLAVEAIISTIDTINNGRDSLPNITLGYIIHDDYGSKLRATEIAMALMNRIIRNGHASGDRPPRDSKCDPETYNDEQMIDHQGIYSKPVVAVVGGTTSDIGMRIATILQPVGIPIINYMATSDRLRRSDAFPFLVNLLPSDKYQAMAIMDLIDEFKWSYVLAVVSTSYYGIEGLAMLEEEAAKRTICFRSQTILMPTGDTSNNTSIRKVVEQIKKDRRLTVVIVFMYLDDVQRLFHEVQRQNVKGITWIASEAWAEKEAILDFPSHVVLGNLGVKLVSRRSRIHGRTCWYPHFNINIWLISFLCQQQNISQNNCSMSSLRHIKGRCLYSFFQPAIIYVWSFAENAVRTAAKALKALVTSSTENTFDYAAMLNSLKPMQFVDSSSVHDNYIGPRVVQYDVVNLQTNHKNGKLTFVQVGKWAKYLSKGNQQKQELSLYKPLIIQWNSGQVPQSRCSEPCAGGYKTEQGPHRCCWHCEICLPGYITNSDKPHVCVECGPSEHPGPYRNQCVTDTQIFLHYKQPRGIALLTTCSFGEVLGFCLFAILRRWNDHRQYIIMPFQKLSLIITMVGFLPPLTFLLQTSSHVCRLRLISFIVFLSTHACFLFCSCGKVGHLVIRMHSTLVHIRKRRQMTTMTRKAWTRSMRIKFAKERKLVREKGDCNNGQGEGVKDGKAWETGKGEIATIGSERMNRRFKQRCELEKTRPMVARKTSEGKERVKVKDEESLSAGRQSDSRHVIPTLLRHAFFFVSLCLSILPFIAMQPESVADVKYVKLEETSGYHYCDFGNTSFFPLFATFHFLHLVVTLVLTNQTKTTPSTDHNYKGNDLVDASLFYVHDKFVYYLSYLMLLIECICIPFSLILPGPLSKDILYSAMIIVIQYSFILTTYGTKVYVIYREQYKNK